MAKQTPMKWSQRADSVLLVIPLRDVENTDVHFSNNRFQFSGNSNGAGYFLDVELFKDIDVQASSWTVKPTSVELKLAKKVVRDPFWPRLLLNKALERNNVTVDWDRYMDEEDLEVNFADEIQNLDAIIADAEEETLITDEILSSLEYHSLYADETISGLTKDFDAINVDADVLISTDNFDPNDPKKRPKLWQNVLSKRVMIKEYVEELEGVSSLAVWKYLDNESAETQVLSTGSYDAIPRMLTLVLTSIFEIDFDMCIRTET